VLEKTSSRVLGYEAENLADMYMHQIYDGFQDLKMSLFNRLLVAIYIIWLLLDVT